MKGGANLALVSTDELAQQAADRVREVIADAERRAEEIIREAEAEAARIRETARAETPDPQPPSPVPEPPVPHPDPTPPADPIPEPPAPTTLGNGAEATGDVAVRLMAMKLALDGKGREEIASELEAKFGAADRGALLDDVLARAGK